MDSSPLRARPARYRRLDPRPVSLSWERWTLSELIWLFSVTAICAYLWSTGATPLAICLFVTSVAMRTAIKDFSPIGGVACALAMLFGIPLLVLTVIWAAT